MTHEATTPSATLTDLIELFKAREAAGLVKYGTTVDRDDLSLADWLQHALEESMDKPIYLMRALKKLRASQPAEQPRGDGYDVARHNDWLERNAQPKPEQAVGDGVVEPKWPGPWNGHRFPVNAIAEVFGKAAFEASAVLRLGAPNHVEIGMALLSQLGSAGFGICRDTPRPAVAAPAEVTDVAKLVKKLRELSFGVREDMYHNDAIADEINECVVLASALTAQCQVRKDTQGLDDSGHLTPDLFDRFKLAARALVREKKVYGEDLETIHDVLRVLEGAAIASPSAGAVVPEGWTGWACQFPGRLPRLYGDRVIAEVNCDTESGDRLLFLVETAAPEVPQP